MDEGVREYAINNYEAPQYPSSSFTSRNAVTQNPRCNPSQPCSATIARAHAKGPGCSMVVPIVAADPLHAW